MRQSKYLQPLNLSLLGALSQLDGSRDGSEGMEAVAGRQGEETLAERPGNTHGDGGVLQRVACLACRLADVGAAGGGRRGRRPGGGARGAAGGGRPRGAGSSRGGGP